MLQKTFTRVILQAQETNGISYKENAQETDGAILDKENRQGVSSKSASSVSSATIRNSDQKRVSVTPKIPKAVVQTNTGESTEGAGIRKSLLQESQMHHFRIK